MQSIPGHKLPMTKSIFLQTLHSIVRKGELTEVLQLASAASQCMREVSVGTETRDIRPPLADKNSEGVWWVEGMGGDRIYTGHLAGKDSDTRSKQNACHI